MDIKTWILFFFGAALPIIIEIIFRLIPKRIFEKNKRLSKIYLQYHRYVPYLFLMSFLIIAVVIINHFDAAITKALGLDFTPHIHKIEGNSVAELQRWMLDSPHSKRTSYFRLTYTHIFAILFYIFIFYFMFKDDKRMVKTLAAAHVFTFIIALPFYIFFPVNEVWTTNTGKYNFYDGKVSSGTLGVLYDIDPEMSDTILTFNSVNNCFPSLHTSISVTIFLILLFTGHKGLAALTLPAAVSILISTIYLGVHWIIDISAGIVLAYIVTYLALNIDYSLEFPLRLKFLKWKGREIHLSRREPRK